MRSALARRLMPAGEQHALFGEEGTGTRFELLFASPEQLATPTQFDAFAREGYRLNSIVGACVVELATSIAEPRLEVQVLNSQNAWEPVRRTRGPLSPAQRLHALLQRPGGDADRKLTPYEWGEQGMSDLAIYGNEFWRKRRSSGWVVALERIQAPYIQPDRDGLAEGGAVRQRVRQVFVRRYLSQNLVTADVDASTPVPYEDLIHIKHYDPLDLFWGLPPIVRCLEETDLDDKTILYLRAFLKNAGTPQGVLKTKGILNADQRRRIQDSWQQQHADPANRHRVAVLDGEADYEEVGTRPDKLKMDNIFDVAESRVCASFGVPPVLAGVRIGIMRATDTNYKNARTSFWVETLSPIYAKREQGMTQQLALDFDPSGETRIKYNLEEVADLQESDEVLYQRARTGYQDGILTQNEGREMVGLARHDGGDVFHTRSSDGPPQKLGQIPELAPKPAGAAAPGPGRPGPKNRQSLGAAPGDAEDPVSHAPGAEVTPGADPKTAIN